MGEGSGCIGKCPTRSYRSHGRDWVSKYYIACNVPQESKTHEQSVRRTLDDLAEDARRHSAGHEEVLVFTRRGSV